MTTKIENSFFEGGVWKFTGGVREGNAYSKLAESLTTTIDAFKNKNNDFGYDHEKLGSIFDKEISDFYSTPAVKDEFTFEDKICDLWCGIFQHEDGHFETVEDCFFSGKFPSEFIQWLATEYDYIYVAWLIEETSRIQNEGKEYLRVIRDIRKHQVTRRGTEKQIDDDLF